MRTVALLSYLLACMAAKTVLIYYILETKEKDYV